MRQRWKWVLGGLVIFTLGFYAGGFFGAHQLWKVLEPVRRTQAAASINFGIDELLFLRTGNPDKALRRMEQRLDGAILDLSLPTSSKELSAADRQPLLLAKKYRARYPFEQASPEAQATLAALPDGPLDPMVRKTAARVLMETEKAPAAQSAP